MEVRQLQTRKLSCAAPIAQCTDFDCKEFSVESCVLLPSYRALPPSRLLADSGRERGVERGAKVRRAGDCCSGSAGKGILLWMPFHTRKPAAFLAAIDGVLAKPHVTSKHWPPIPNVCQSLYYRRASLSPSFFFLSLLRFLFSPHLLFLENTCMETMLVAVQTYV